MMLAMSNGLDNSITGCSVAAEETNAQILEQANLENYTNAKFNYSDFID